MKVVTVTGNVDPEDLGVTMTHEHIRYLTLGVLYRYLLV